MYLLLRRSCTLFQDFSIYCTTRNFRIKTNETPKATPKKLMSPKLIPKILQSPKYAKPKIPIEKPSFNYPFPPPPPQPVQYQSLIAKIVNAHKTDDKVYAYDSSATSKELNVFTFTIPKISEEIKEKSNEDKNLPVNEFTDILQNNKNPFLSNKKPFEFSPKPNIEKKQQLLASAKLPGQLSNQQEENKASIKEISYCKCGKICNVANETKCSDCLAKIAEGTVFGYLYEKGDDKNLWRHWYKLFGTLLYSNIYIYLQIGYRAKTDEIPNGIYPLSDCYIREEPQELLDGGRIMSPFILFFGAYKLKVYAIKVIERKQWIESIHEAIGFRDIFDYYRLIVLFSKNIFI